eukprot:NODE_47_length_27404_cov_0.284270.p2 type:complete len:1085 gc:universal NODE_47_length_27404_cov_0.284270:12640-15894(+)
MILTVMIIRAVQCGPSFGACADQLCCSKFGNCGDSSDFCEVNAGCNTKYGFCWGVCAPYNGECTGPTDCCSTDGWCGTSNEHCNPTPKIRSCVNPKHAHIMINAPLRIRQYSDAFNSFNISGSFFINADNYANMNELDLDLLYAVDNGHEIGMFSNQVQTSGKLSSFSAYNLIKPNVDIIRYVSGVAPVAYIPKSFENGTYTQAASQLGLSPFSDPTFSYNSSESLIDSLLMNSPPILMALDSDDFIQSLPQIIDYYQFKRFKFVSLSACLGKPKSQFPFTGLRPRSKSNRPTPIHTPLPVPIQSAPFNSCNDKQIAVVVIGGPSKHYNHYLRLTQDLNIPINFFPSTNDSSMAYNRDALELSKNNQFGLQFSYNAKSNSSILTSTNYQRQVTQMLTHNNGHMFIYPDFGAWNSSILAQWNDLGYTVVSSNLDSEDWRINPSKKDVMDSVDAALSYDEDSGYILTCSGYVGVCADAIPSIAGTFLVNNYTFVNLDTCLNRTNSKILEPHQFEYNSLDTSVVSGAVSSFCGPLYNNQKCDTNYCCSIFGTCGLNKNFCYGDYFCGWNCKGDEPPFLPGALEEPILTCKNKKQVALTFDDGPHANYTDLYLDVLQRRNITATFFVSGYNLIKNQKPFLRTLKLGHEIAHHTWNHSDSQILIKDSAGFDFDMKSNAELIYNLTGKNPHFFRPPFGSFNQETMDRWHALGMVPVIWDIDSNDWRNPTLFDLAFTNIIDSFNADTDGPHIILCHDIHPTCLKHLDDIIDLFLSFNYTFVNTSECLGLSEWQEDVKPDSVRTPFQIEYPSPKNESENVPISLTHDAIANYSQSMSSVYQPAIYKKCINKVVHILVIDGPSDEGMLIQEELINNKINGTWMLSDTMVQNYRQVLDISKQQAVGLSDFTGNATLVDELRELLQTLTHNNGYRYIYSDNHTALGIYNDLGYYLVHSNLDPEDYMDNSTLSLNTIKSALQLDSNKGYIINCGGYTQTCASIMGEMVQLFKSYGYTFATLQDCLRLPFIATSSRTSSEPAVTTAGNAGLKITIPTSQVFGSNATYPISNPPYNAQCGPLNDNQGCETFYCCNMYF